MSAESGFHLRCYLIEPALFVLCGIPAVGAADRILFAEVKSAALGRSLLVAVVKPLDAADRNIPAQVQWLEGGHEFSLVERAMPLVLADAARFFEKKTARK